MGDQAVMAARIASPATASPSQRVGVNVLMEAAHPVLELVCRLKLREFEEAIEPLRVRLRAMIDAFDERVRRAGVDEQSRTVVHYCLCTFVDEAVAATPSGGAGAWASHSLLVTFHKEASGGERFFSFLDSLSRDPATHLDVLELIYVMLALGMEGRYRLLENGPFQLETVRDKLRRMLVAQRGSLPAWPGAAHMIENKWQGRGQWPVSRMLVAGALAMSASLAVTLEISLHEQAWPVVETLGRVRVAQVSAPTPSPASTASSASTNVIAQTLSHRLAQDLDAHRVAIYGSPGRAVLTLGSDGLFASGSSTVLASRAELLRRIGGALRDLDARIVVVGHTDDEPTSPGRPTNWQLSLARATVVVNLLREEAGDPERFFAQGRGASEPVAANDSPANRARNRRVVVTVVARGGAL